jgi:hypothetical protein
VGRTIRFSIAGLMGVVLVAAIGMAALRSASETWAGVLFFSACGAFTLAIVGIIYRGQAERAWWLGFALFGWGYLAAAFWPMDHFRLPVLPTAALLESLSSALGVDSQGTSSGPSTVGMGSVGRLQSFRRVMVSPFVVGSAATGVDRSFQQVGHSLLALVFAIVGGTLAAILFAIPSNRAEGQPAEADTTRRWTWKLALRPAIIGPLGLVLIALITVVGMRAVPSLAAGTIYLVTCGFLGLAALGAIVSEKGCRDIWLGAALFGAGYMILAFGRAGAPHPQPHYPTDEFLTVFRPWLARPAEGYFISAETEAGNARIAKALAQPIPMSFANETPLDDILKYIQQATEGPDGKRIPIYVDPFGLQEVETTLTSTVIIDLEGVPLRTTLRECLRQLGLGYCIDDGFLKISSESRVWPVYQDPFLMGGHCIFALIAAALGGALTRLVAGARRRRGPVSG